MTRLVVNTRCDRSGPFPAELATGFGSGEMAEAARWARACPRFAPSTLLDLADFASRHGVSAVMLLDETRRFGLGSFKALGGAYAVIRQVAERIGHASGVPPERLDERFRAAAAAVTVVCATDGNHGRSVAAGARLVGCRCEIFLHSGVSAEREFAIAALGAVTRRIAGDYDHSVRAAAAAARAEGWILVADTANDAEDPVPGLVMSGYGVLVEDALARLPAPPSHVFVQAGVGGLAGAVLSALWQKYGAARPLLVVVEPQGADCLLESALAGGPRPLGRPLDTQLAMLECGEPSATAWPLIDRGADAFLAIADSAAFRTVIALARRAAPLAVGESGAAGLAGFVVAASDPSMRHALGITQASSVLAIATEGPTDRALFDAILQGAT